MNHSTEDHLLRLHEYLQTKVCNRPGINVIKTGIMSHCRQEFLAVKIDQNKMCPYCFHRWCEGDFSLKFRSKNSKKKENVKLYVWKMKCSNCGKHICITHEKPPSKSCQVSRKKVIATDHKSSHPQKVKKALESFQKTRRKMKNDIILLQSQKRQKEPKILLPKKKSRLTYLNDFL